MTAAGPRGWDFWVDRGGTFTDIVSRDPSGVMRSMKLLSDDPGRYADAAVEGIRRFLASVEAKRRRIASVKMGTTVATNALLERRGEPTLLVITAGLKDALRIGTQQRPEIFALQIELPEMLYVRSIEAAERISAQGEVIVALDERRLRADLQTARAAGIASVAIVLLHGYRFPRHERMAAQIACELGFEQVSVSHEVSPLMKLVSRGDTTLVDAYLSPVLRRYVTGVRHGLERHLGAAPLLFMQSHGGLVDGKLFRGKDSILSGPAGGVVGMATTARAAGFEQVIGFDMGGTSTDVSLYDAEFERTASAVIAGVRISAPMMRIHTVAAGGGSLLKFAGARLQVGPESAGADPGPACYRKGGPLTITDANLHLGRIQAELFPRLFGEHADQTIDAEVVARAFKTLASEIAATAQQDLSTEQIASGFLRIAVERMANAIKQISIQRGRDIRRFVLSSFGGAGGQHACQVADALGLETVLVHPLAGVMSAYGMGVADLRSVRQRAVEARLDASTLGEVRTIAASLAREARADLSAQGLSAEHATVGGLTAPSAETVIDQQPGARGLVFEHRLRLKLQGSDASLPVRWSLQASAETLTESFHEAHAQYFGFRADEAVIVVESIELEAIAAVEKPEQTRWAGGSKDPAPLAVKRVWFAESWIETAVYARDDLGAGALIAGPAIIAEANATTVIEPDWRAEVDPLGSLILTRVRPRAIREAVDKTADPVMLEVFNSLFMHIAEQMGVVLENTAHSVNIKERLDFSCALFDEAGELIANAPHIPVHLGSMGDTVQSILRDNAGSMAPGDVFMLNTPYNGGTHLPDITVVTPVFDTGRAGAEPPWADERRAPEQAMQAMQIMQTMQAMSGHRLRFVVASRAHHADIGGLTPGSMPPGSRTIEQEGVMFDGVAIVRRGRFLEADVRRLLGAGPYPARNPDQNIADLKAQIAANTRGIEELEKMVARFGLDVVHAYMAHVKRNAEECVRRAIDRLHDGRWTVQLDGGERISVSVQIDHARREAIIDFAGTSVASRGNFNAPASITRAAVLYVFRTLVRENIPLNAGCLKPLHIRLPDNSLLNPRYPAAVVAGNVETSQCITDALLAALGACAAAQGTMNNLTFGDAEHQYYETICGGAGAGPDFDGADAVHTHMTNSRLTDPEVIEWRYPVRVRRFGLREGSGGSGRRRGGDGVVREIEFLAAMHAAILSNRRRVAPFGLNGGRDGAPGRNSLIRASGRIEDLPATAEVDVAPGDRLVIETPGGGGYG